MKKKKVKKLIKEALEKALRPRRPRQVQQKPSPEILSLMQKVKRQLEDIQKPLPLKFSRTETSWNPTIADYAAMDPCHWSTMRVDVRLCS